MDDEPVQQEKQEIDAAPIEAAIEEMDARVAEAREERELRLRTRPQSPSTEDDTEQVDGE